MRALCLPRSQYQVASAIVVTAPVCGGGARRGGGEDDAGRGASKTGVRRGRIRRGGGEPIDRLRRSHDESRFSESTTKKMRVRMWVRRRSRKHRPENRTRNPAPLLVNEKSSSSGGSNLSKSRGIASRCARHPEMRSFFRDPFDGCQHYGHPAAKSGATGQGRRWRRFWPAQSTSNRRTRRWRSKKALVSALALRKMRKNCAAGRLGARFRCFRSLVFFFPPLWLFCRYPFDR